MNRNFTLVEKLYDNFNNFNCYKVIVDGITSFVPNQPANKDYKDIQEYIKNGGVVIDNGGN